MMVPYWIVSSVKKANDPTGATQLQCRKIEEPRASDELELFF